MEFPVRSGIVDGLFTVALEVIAVRVLGVVVEGITRQFGNRGVNKHGYLKVFSTKWTTFLGRGTSMSGHIWRTAFYLLATISISLITYGTTGFTKIEYTQKEVVYVTQTDDVKAQYELAVDEAMGVTANWAFTSRLHWCTRRDKDAVHVYSAFCDTELCMESLRKDSVQREEEYEMLLDHFEENGRCNDGSDAPERELSPHFEVVSHGRNFDTFPIDAPRTNWTTLIKSDEFKFRLFWDMFVERNGTEEDGAKYLVCAHAFYEKYHIRSFALLEILADDLVRVSMPNKAAKLDWDVEPFPQAEGSFPAYLENCLYLVEDDKDDFGVGSVESLEVRVKNKNVLVSDVTKWLLTATILSLTDSFRSNTWRSLTMVNLKIKSGVLPIDFVRTQATRISTASIVGFLLLVAAALLTLSTLAICAGLGRMRSYEAGNLALNDREIYGLLNNQANNLGDARTAKAKRLELGFSSSCERWGVLS